MSSLLDFRPEVHKLPFGLDADLEMIKDGYHQHFDGVVHQQKGDRETYLAIFVLHFGGTLQHVLCIYDSA